MNKMGSSSLLLLSMLLRLGHAAVKAQPQHVLNQRGHMSGFSPEHAPPQQRHLTSSNIFRPHKDDISSDLKRKLMINYDPSLYPWQYAWRENSSSGNNTTSNKKEGVKIETGINFHRIVEVDVTKSTVDIVAWFRMRWVDPRLVWDPLEFDNTTSLHFVSSELWTPDLELWNQETPLVDSFAAALLIVSPDGTVFWSRPGHLRPICRFSGLENFPFDSLGCTVEIGSWSYSGMYLRPALLDKGFTIGGSETAGEAYAEFSLEDLSAEVHVYPPYPAAPNEDWPALLYHLVLSRAWQPYVSGYIVLQIVFNICAFSCFWLPPQCGERLSLSITAMLAAVAADLVIVAKLPASGEITWVSAFAAGSLLFATAGLLQSAVVVYFYFHTGHDMFPAFLKKFISKWRKNHQNGQDSAKIRRSLYIPENMEESSSQEDDYPIGNHPIRDHVEGRTVWPLDKNPAIGLERSISRMSRKSKMNLFQSQHSSAFYGRDANDFKNEEEKENNARWQKVAANVDQVSRVLFPIFYVVFLAERFSIFNHV